MGPESTSGLLKSQKHAGWEGGRAWYRFPVSEGICGKVVRSLAGKGAKLAAGEGFTATSGLFAPSAGIEPTGNMVKKRAEFTVETRSAGQGEVLVYVEDPAGHQEEVGAAVAGWETPGCPLLEDHKGL